MPLNIKNPEVERLADEVAGLTGESKTEAIRKALEERRARLNIRLIEDNREARLLRFLENELWPVIPRDQAGKSRLATPISPSPLMPGFVMAKGAIRPR